MDLSDLLLQPCVLKRPAGGACDARSLTGPGDLRSPKGDREPLGLLRIIPICRRLGLGIGPRQIGSIGGISMGGYGAILFAEKFVHTISACAAISPSILTRPFIAYLPLQGGDRGYATGLPRGIKAGQQAGHAPK
jgi:hypothetical protein